MAIGEVMFLAAIAWVKRGGRGKGKKNFNIKENNCLLLNKNCFFQSFCKLLQLLSLIGRRIVHNKKKANKRGYRVE